MKFSYVTIRVDHLDESVGFFCELMGFVETRRFKPREGMEIVFLDQAGSTGVELIQEPGFIGATDALTLTFEVEDMALEIARFERYGTALSAGPFPIGMDGKLALFEDPSGIKIGLIAHS